VVSADDYHRLMLRIWNVILIFGLAIVATVACGDQDTSQQTKSMPAEPTGVERGSDSSRATPNTKLSNHKANREAPAPKVTATPTSTDPTSASSAHDRFRSCVTSKLGKIIGSNVSLSEGGFTVSPEIDPTVIGPGQLETIFGCVSKVEEEAASSTNKTLPDA